MRKLLQGKRYLNRHYYVFSVLNHYILQNFNDFTFCILSKWSAMQAAVAMSAMAGGHAPSAETRPLGLDAGTTEAAAFIGARSWAWAAPWLPRPPVIHRIALAVRTQLQPGLASVASTETTGEKDVVKIKIVAAAVTRSINWPR